jgi:uncharacterized protein (TIGR00255 family)
MTGFGKGEIEKDKYRLSIELKSVNNRFKDMRFKMGSIFSAHELPMRKKIEANFTRGSFDIMVHYKKTYSEEVKVDLDYKKIDTFIQTIKENISTDNISLNINPTDYLRSDFYMENTEKEDELNSMIMDAFILAIDSLKESREEEGSKLIDTLKVHRDEFMIHFAKVSELRNSYQDQVKEKLTKRFENDAKELNLDEPRFLQEVIYYLEKLDIDEEINRITIHLEKLEKILTGEHLELGRQIDFLIQELNRETNTIGSKSGASGISENVVQMKVQLEKIREQALNLQ